MKCPLPWTPSPSAFGGNAGCMLGIAKGNRIGLPADSGEKATLPAAVRAFLGSEAFWLFCMVLPQILTNRRLPTNYRSKVVTVDKGCCCDSKS